MEHTDSNYSTKVAIVGTGFVGSSAAYAIMLDGVASEIALIDKKKEIAEGHALDFMHGMQFTKSTKIVASDSFELVKDAQIVVLTAGISQKIGQTREELLDANVKIFKEIIPQVVKYNKKCILLVVTNPLDVMTYVTYKLSGFDSCRVFGTGTVLDTSRLRYLLGEELKVSPKDITAYILGEHGDSQFVWWSHANVAGIPIRKYISEDLLEKIHRKVKKSVYEVIKRKGATYYAVAIVISKIVKAILLDQSRIFTVSNFLQDYHGVNEVYLSIPTVVRQSGIYQRLEILLDKSEEKMFDNCVKKTKNIIEEAKKFGI
ncbi:L-lactate dehydrogenase [Candidatus Babeliales bacterium]|nr:L-lactate dehydrogenase [Candidatus Babeliales bacterium]